MNDINLSGININCYNGIKLSFDDNLHFVTTLNAELIIKANDDKKLKSILNKGLVTIDGQWTLIAAKRKYRNIKNFVKVSGSDYIYKVIDIVSKNEKKVLLLGSTVENNIKAVENLKKLYNYNNIFGFSPVFSNYPFSKNFLNDIEEIIKLHKPHVIITAFGVPKQEYWANDNIEMLKKYGVNYIMFFGGAIDIVSGKYKKAPKIIHKLGIESPYRLLQDITRVKRELKKLKFFSLMLAKKL